MNKYNCPACNSEVSTDYQIGLQDLGARIICHYCRTILTVGLSQLIVTDLCERCRINEAEHLHACPYESEINHDKDFTCNCCSSCERRCSAEI